MTSQEIEKIKDLRDYAELAWASYSTGLRSGMFGADSKGDRGEITDKEYEKLPTYFRLKLGLTHIKCTKTYDFKNKNFVASSFG